ncbi:hypothetical protein NDU88_003434 [Pleurodeles waltl]|uniref:Uncharacterized protein n=1 Tax=Pleurodeles waltl TaxID=8319 RepID=A0AAV7MRM7_PLEWA|nr:hypothetical protein NDU88_003434 [Pleurodeles waltl]
MAPKISQNLGEKGEGARAARIKKLNGELIPRSRSPASTLGKLSGKLSAGVIKEVKSSIPPSSTPVEDKTQPTIMCYLKGGSQENNPEYTVPLLVDTQLPLNGKRVADGGDRGHSEDAREIAKGKDSLLTRLHAEVELLEGGKDHPAQLKYKEMHIPLGENMQPSFAEPEIYDVLQASQGKATGPPVGDAGDLSHMAQSPEAGVEAIGTKKKVPDWSKDGGDKLYSLTEDSDSTNSNQSLTETGASISSESGSFLSPTESTVRQRQRESKGLKVRTPIRDGVELSAQSRKTLKWDYSGTNLMSTAEAHIPEAQVKAEKRADAPVCSSDLSIGTRNTDSEMLQSIYDSIKELQTETRAESRRARLATKQLQGTVCKVVKSCTEIEEKLSTMEERTMAVEADEHTDSNWLRVTLGGQIPTEDQTTLGQEVTMEELVDALEALPNGKAVGPDG